MRVFSRMLLAAAAVVGCLVPMSSVQAARLHRTTKCTAADVCVEVTNAAAGSDRVYYIEVSGPYTGVWKTIRVIVNGYPAWGQTTSTGFIVWNLGPRGRVFKSGTRIQGGIEGHTGGRTPAWVAP